MTGKDFSGPTPIIKAPTPPQLAEPLTEPLTDGGDDQHTSVAVSAIKIRKKSRTPGAVNDGEEIIGSIEDEH